MDAIGAHQFWGFSPALDFQQIVRSVFGSDFIAETAHSDGASKPASRDSGAAKPKPLCFLLLQPGDPRHIIKTIAQRHRHSGRALHFYLYENPPEVLARDALLLAVATDWELPLRQRANLWLEVYGNALLQSRTAAYISTVLRPLLLDVLGSSKGRFPLPSLLNFSLLKYKQRDELEDAIKAYHDSVAFDMTTLRNYRLRHTYGARYDFRNNLIDWDYQTVIRKAAGCIHFSQYREWRNTGVAFEFGDQQYDTPNRSLASFIEGRESGRSTLRRGYWGDTLVSPYHAVATAGYVPTESEVAASTRDASGPGTSSCASTSDTASFAHHLFDITSRHSGSEQWRHHAVEIATYNVLSWLYEIETGKQYVMRREHDTYSGLADMVLARDATVGKQTATPTVDAGVDASTSPAASVSVSAKADVGSVLATAAESAGVEEEMLAAQARSISRKFADVKVFALSGDMKELVEKRKHAGLFHAVSLSGRSVHLLSNPAFPSLFSAAGGVAVCETATNVVNLTVENRREFSRRVMGMALAAGLVFVDSDRNLSADTFSVGTDMDPKPASTSTATKAVKCSTFENSTSWITSTMGADVSNTSSGGTIGDRVKHVPMAAYSHNPAPHPAIASLLHATVDTTAFKSAVSAHQSHIAGIDHHDTKGGDNPFPSALLFAYVPTVAKVIQSLVGDSGATPVSITASHTSAITKDSGSS